MTARNRPKATISTTFDGYKSDYEAGKTSRFVRRRTGLPSGGSGADYHFRSEAEYYRLIEMARDYDRNDALCGQTIDRVVANVIQDGFTLIPNTGDKKLDEELWYRWVEYSTDPDMCDVAGESTFHELEKLALRSSLLDGDCVLIGTQDGPLQFFEAHDIGTDNVKSGTFCGVDVGPLNQRIRYWVAPEKPGGMHRGRTKETASPLDVRNADGVRQLFHVYDPHRKSQTRGVTTLMPIFSVMGMIEDINFAKLVQQQIVSCFTIFRQRALDPSTTLPGGAPSYGESSTEATESGTRYIEGIQPGMEIVGQPGEQLQGFSPNTPNSEYFQHFRQQVGLVGATFNLSPAQVLLDFSMENFVGYRGALHEARKGLRSKQQMLRQRLHKPSYEWKVSQWVSDDPTLARFASRKKVRIFDHKWQPPSFEYLEPVNDAAGDLLRVRNNLTSRRRLHAERSQDWEEIAEESVDDNAYAILLAKKKAMDINAEFPDDPNPVTWRDLISLPTPDGIQVGITAGGGTESATTAKPIASKE